MRLRWLGSGILAGSLSLAFWAGWNHQEQARSVRLLGIARQDIAAGRYASARSRLVELSRSHHSQDEVYFQLGLCEKARGRSNAALDAWQRVAPSSSFGERATLARARVLTNTGRFAAAEPLLSSLRRSGHEGSLARQALELLLRIEGRTDEVLPLILETWEGATDPAAVLRRVYLLDNSAYPIDYVRAALAAGDRDDDRIWLGKANLAAWEGKFAQAATWLDRCTERRPDDRAVWRARLELAVAALDLAAFQGAALHLAATDFTSIELLRLKAWVAGRLKDSRRERDALQELADRDPGNVGVWDRLAELAVTEGRAPDAQVFRRRKAEVNADRKRYKNLIERDDRASHASELEVLATRLGRRIEARGWSLISLGRAGQERLVPDPEGRLDVVIPGTSAAAGAHHGTTLAAALEPLLSSATAASARTPELAGVPSPSFQDEGQSAGLNFVHNNGQLGQKNPPPPETMCGGVALLDFDGDGWLDVYAVQAGPFPPTDVPGRDGDRLFRNRGDGTLEDVTKRAGIAKFRSGYGHGVAVGDIDNDGRPDLFITRWRSYALYRNQGDGTFADVTEAAGLSGDRDWPTSAAFADLDGDGDLDLYVCHYLRYDPLSPKRCEHPDSPGRHDCYPLDFPALADHVFRNEGGRLIEVTSQAGFVDRDGRGLGVVAAQLDEDDRIDLYVANDMTANYLFHNLGGFRFEEIGQLAGAAASADGGFKAGMGIACGDLDGDGLIDLAVTNYFGESTTFYRNLGGGFFADHSTAVGMAAATRRLLGFGIAMLDVNNDGWLDVLSVNGHVQDERPRIPLAMPMQLLLARPGGRLLDVSEASGPPFTLLHLGRGLAVGDLDNDGRLDAVVLAQNEPLIALRNRTEPRGHFIRFQLEGTRSNRDGVGARITISHGGRRQVSQRTGGGSYQSSSDPRIHFGLGTSTRIETLEIRWPSGQVDRHRGLDADCDYLVREGSPAVTTKAVRRTGRVDARNDVPAQSLK